MKSFIFQHNDPNFVSKMAGQCGIRAITIHGRTCSDGFSGKADRSVIAKEKVDPAVIRASVEAVLDEAYFVAQNWTMTRGNLEKGLAKMADELAESIYIGIMSSVITPRPIP